MIKNFEKFFEASEYDFRYSNERREVVKKWGISIETIDDYLEDLKDDNIYYTFNQGILDFDDKNNPIDVSSRFQMICMISFEYELNPVKELGEFASTVYNFTDYKKFITNQVEVIDKVENSIKRLMLGEGLELIKKYVSDVPFYMIQDERKNLLKISYRLKFEVESDDYQKAKDKFFKKPNPIGEAEDKVVKFFVDEGILPKFAKDLIDIDPGHKESKVVRFGFLTDNEIYVVASYDKETKKLEFHDKEIDNALADFYDGYCSSYLGNDYLDINERM